MIFQRLRVFVSSKMQELEPERQALEAALDSLKWMPGCLSRMLAHGQYLSKKRSLTKLRQRIST